ncbi:archaeosortase/exosortase family protein [Motiliproteus sp. SC1-56]|uniref:archaeosortase/exosortase family protein n=1 Tax=Motiliproteus sp. SC1-56 TaxID=2799565 RepID=UPI001A8CBA20|nr:archaeosortase/exosortase family protein [Motiliproteus sp. SC1-56]
MAQEKYSTISAYRFSFRFLVLLSALFLALGLLPVFSLFGLFIGGLIDLTGSLVVVLLKPFGVPVIYEDTFATVTVSGFKMLIDPECTAFYFLLIFSVAVITSPPHNISHKIKGILAGGVIIIFLNVLRIAVLGVTGANFPAIFNFMHTYLWQGVFAIAVFFIWLSWNQGPSASKTLLTFCSVAIFVSIIAILGLWLVMGFYLNVLASVSEWAFNAFLSSSYFSVTAANEAITYHHLGGFVTFPISVDIFDSSIFFALTIASAKANDIGRLAVKLVCGLGVLWLVHLIFAMVVGYLVIQGVSIESELSTNTLLLMRIYSITIPVLLWALMSTNKWAWLRKER